MGTSEALLPQDISVRLLVDKLEDRLRRALAIDRLPGDEELRRVATDRTHKEAEALRAEADEYVGRFGED